jgi:hypothetical protein
VFHLLLGQVLPELGRTLASNFHQQCQPEQHWTRVLLVQPYVFSLPNINATWSSGTDSIMQVGVWHIYQLQPASVTSCYDSQALFSGRGGSSSISLSTATPHLYVFFCCHGALSIHQVLIQTWENSCRNTQTAWTYLEQWSPILHTCL